MNLQRRAEQVDITILEVLPGFEGTWGFILEDGEVCSQRGLEIEIERRRRNDEGWNDTTN